MAYALSLVRYRFWLTAGERRSPLRYIQCFNNCRLPSCRKGRPLKQGGLQLPESKQSAALLADHGSGQSINLEAAIPGTPTVISVITGITDLKQEDVARG
jgi:hypothetical protein